MTAKQMRALLVEDSAEDLQNADRLSRGGLKCFPFRVIGDPERFRNALENELTLRKIDVLLLDYRLDDEKDASGQRLSLRGGAVAADVREEHPSLPIVLLTTEAKLQRWLGRTPSVHSLFDRQILKSQLETTAGREHAVRCVVDLARGYSRVDDELRTHKSVWDAIAALMSAHESEASLVQQLYAEPPTAAVSAVAAWFLQRALRWPGMLLSAWEVAARLGVTALALSSTSMESWLSPVRYRGVFAECDAFWWRGRLADRIGSELDVAAGGVGPALVRKLRLTAKQLARCKWCGDTAVFRPCAICHEAADRPHHLMATIDDRPKWAEPALICFTCIQRGKADAISFPPGADEVAGEIRSGKLTPSRAKH